VASPAGRQARVHPLALEFRLAQAMNLIVFLSTDLEHTNGLPRLDESTAGH
jgi:hypothetical protein